jgi:hypothetical protein
VLYSCLCTYWGWDRAGRPPADLHGSQPSSCLLWPMSRQGNLPLVLVAAGTLNEANLYDQSMDHMDSFT